MESKQEKEKKINEENLLVNPNEPISEKQLKSIKRRHLAIEIVLGIFAAAVLVAMICVLVLVKK